MDKGKAEPPCSHTRRFRFPKEGVKNETQNSNGGVTPSRYHCAAPPAQLVTKSPCNPMWREVRWFHHMS
nr:MAG TPA: hypothetical protein [Caudoviricetes sp.]